MSVDNLAIFQMAKMRMGWAAQRQKVLAQNVANANTPGYVARDLHRLDFKNLAQSQEKRPEMLRTNVGHMAPKAPNLGPYREVEERYPFESAPDGNEVVVEEQMTLLSETKNQYKVSLELYKKHLTMLKSVLRTSR